MYCICMKSTPQNENLQLSPQKMRWEIGVHFSADKYCLQSSHCVDYLDITECLDFQEWESTDYSKTGKYLLIKQSHSPSIIVAVIPGILM